MPTFGGPYYGAQRPKYITGACYAPDGVGGSATAFATTANRCYYIPFEIFEPVTFASAQAFNGGAGDNGEKFRIMMFKDDGATGGPGTLAKDFGEITLSAASALRTLSSSWAAAAGMYWGAIWHDSASSMYGWLPYTVATAVGFSMGPSTISMLGDFSATPTCFGAIQMSSAHYVDTAYGAAPATAVAPTASVILTNGSTTPVVPAFVLRK